MRKKKLKNSCTVNGSVKKRHDCRQYAILTVKSDVTLSLKALKALSSGDVRFSMKGSSE